MSEINKIKAVELNNNINGEIKRGNETNTIIAENHEISKEDTVNLITENNISISDLFPDVFRNYAKELATSLQLDANAVATCILTAVATATQKKFNVQVKPRDKTYTEELNIGVILIAKSSERKSPLLKETFKPLTQSDIDYNNQNNVVINQNIAELITLKTKRDSYIKQLGSGKQLKNNDITQENLNKIVEEIETYNKPVTFKQSTVSDVTPESLTILMQEQDEKITILDDEGTILKIVAGLYTGQSNIDIILKSMSNDTYIQNRVGRKKVMLKNPCLTALISVQHQVIKNLLNNQEFDDKGLLGRFLKIVPVSQVGGRILDSNPVAETTYQAYRKALIKINDNKITVLKASGNVKKTKAQETEIENELKTLKLDKHAYKKLCEFHSEIEKQINTSYEHISSYVGKTIGRTSRIAGLLHVMQDATQHTETPFKSDISIETMTKAIEISKFFLAQELSLYSVSVQTLDVLRAEAIIKKLRQAQRTTGYTATQIKQCIRSKELEITNDTLTDTIKPSLDMLVSKGYLKLENSKYFATAKIFTK